MNPFRTPTEPEPEPEPPTGSKYKSVPLYEGACRGGPLDRSEAVSRFPKGFLLVDKRNNQCWLYDWDDGKKEFRARQEEPMDVQTVGPKNRFRAAAESKFDVLAAPWGGEASDNASS